MRRRRMRLTEQLVARVPPHNGASGRLEGRSDLPSDAEYAAAVSSLLTGAPSGEVWMFRAAGGAVELEDSVYFDPAAAAPSPTMQVVVRAEVVEYLGQVTWSFGRIAEASAS